MLAVEELLSELEGEETRSMKNGLPPGFRFHPTDEELITFYLASKVFTGGFCGVEIVEVDLHKYEPWELPDAAKMGEREWYFFNLRDRKYPTGLRTNRATEAGYWKATGKDKQVYSSSSSGSSSSTSANNNNFDCNINVASSSTSSTSALLLGMKKTLVFYKGRAPRGVKTKWVMHEYRLAGHFSSRHTCQEEWVICRIFYRNGEKKVGDQQVQGQAYATSPNTFGSLPPLLEAPASTILADGRSQFCTQQEPTIQNHFMIVDQHNEDNYLKSLLHLNSLVSDFNVSAINGLFPQPSLSTTAISVPITISTTTGATEAAAAAAAATTTNKRMGTNTNSSSSSRSSVSHLLSHQDCTFKEEYPVLKQCKTETTYSQFQVPVYDANNLNLKWMDNFCCHNPNPSSWTDPLSSFLEMDRNVLRVSPSAPASTTPAVDTSADETSSSMAFYGNCSQIPTDPMVNLGPHQIRN